MRQLKIGGIMVLPVGDRHGEQRLLRVARLEERIEADDMGPVRFVPLVSTPVAVRGREGV